MTAYYLVFIITFLIQFFPVSSKSGYKKRLFFTFLPLFLFGALRVDFGNDYKGYEGYFEAVNISNYHYIDDHIETGYAMLNIVMPNFRSLLVFTSLLMCLSYATFFYKHIHPNYTWLAVLLLFLSGDKTIYFTLVAMRNGIAVSLLILSFSFIQNRKVFPFIFTSLLAFYFHTSAIFFFPIAYIIASNKAITRRESITLTLFIILMFTLSTFFLLRTITPFINTYFERYIPVISFIEDVSRETGRGFLATFGSILLIIATLVYALKNRFHPIDNTLLRLSLLFLISFLLGSLSTRMSQYFVVFFIVASTSMYANWNNNLKYAYITLVISFLGYAFFNVWMGSQYFSHDVYHSVFGDI